jgi:hypothetical protein
VSLTLKEIEFNALRANAGQTDRAWSHLELRFNDGTDHLPSVRLVLLQTVRPDMTIAELEREATGLAKTILREALSLLEEQGVTSLLQEQGARDEAARRELAALHGTLSLDGIKGED